MTPNLAEARILAGTDGDRRTLAERIVARGAGAVLITGGEGEGSDLLFDGADYVEIPVAWVDGSATHGTGCTHSATLTAELALRDTAHRRCTARRGRHRRCHCNTDSRGSARAPGQLRSVRPRG